MVATANQFNYPNPSHFISVSCKCLPLPLLPWVFSGSHPYSMQGQNLSCPDTLCSSISMACGTLHHVASLAFSLFLSLSLYCILPTHPCPLPFPTHASATGATLGPLVTKPYHFGLLPAAPPLGKSPLAPLHLWAPGMSCSQDKYHFLCRVPGHQPLPHTVTPLQGLPVEGHACTLKLFSQALPQLSSWPNRTVCLTRTS